MACIEKRCPACELSKSAEEFYIARRRSKVSLSGYCKKCTYQKSKSWSSQNRDKRRKDSYKRMFNISSEEIDCMLEKQEHICAICKRSDSRHLSLDHCHVTGKVRKFLCDKCNLGLGKFEDNIESLLNAVKYLKEFKD